MKKKMILSILLILSLFFIIVGGISGYSMMYKGIKIRYSSLTSYDGTQIAILIAEPEEENNRFGNTKYGVVVAHGIIGKAESNLPLISELARAGFTVVALDERGHGNSGGRIERLHVGEKEYQDVVRCAEFLKKELNCKKVCLVGHSLGGMAVTRAAIWAEKKDIVDIAGTIAISAAVGSSKDNEPPESLALLYEIFSKTFNFEMEFANIEDEMNESKAPYNFLVVISENDGLIPVDRAEELCDLAGGPGKTSNIDFESGNASDLFIIEKEDNAPDHGSTPKDARVIEKVIEWFEKSIGIEDRYEFHKNYYQKYWEGQKQSFGLAVLGVYLLLIPIYMGVKNKILIFNRKSNRKNHKLNVKNIENNDLNNEPNNISSRDLKNIWLIIGISLGATLLAPFITMLLKIPTLQTYIFINVLIRDLVIASAIILCFIFILKIETFNSIFNSENVKKFLISSFAAMIMLFIFILGMNLFDTYYDVNNKWSAFTFNPFIPQRLLMFLILLIEILFVMGVIEYICRNQIQNNLFNAKSKFKVSTWFKVSIFNGVLKSIIMVVLIIGIYFAYDINHLIAVINVSFWILIGFSLIFIIIEFFLTIAYQHSKDFWFVIIACYGYFAWFVASWLIRV